MSNIDKAKQLAEALGGKAKELRDGAGLTMQEVADKTDAGLVISTIHRVEKGIGAAQLDTLVDVFGALGYDIEISLLERPKPQPLKRIAIR